MTKKEKSLELLLKELAYYQEITFDNNEQVYQKVDKFLKKLYDAGGYSPTYTEIPYKQCHLARYDDDTFQIYFDEDESGKKFVHMTFNVYKKDKNLFCDLAYIDKYGSDCETEFLKVPLSLVEHPTPEKLKQFIFSRKK